MSMSFRFCPKCGAKLAEQTVHGTSVPVCINSDCRFRFYQNAKPASTGVLVNDQGEVLLCIRKADPDRGKLDLPGGFCEAHEHPVTAVMRELHEELAIEVEVVGALGMIIDRYPYDGIAYSSLNLGFVVKSSGGSIQPHDDITGVAWKRPDEVAGDELAFSNNQEFLRRFQRWQQGEDVSLLVATY